MFKAILPKSAEQMPTDLVSDPISDPKFFPILAAKSSFGASAQLKNAVSVQTRILFFLYLSFHLLSLGRCLQSFNLCT
ncbi:hypothetical protein NMG60_11032433 [Bertholletia excelsa]